MESVILSGVENIVAIASGKGGVGKSTITANLAVSLAKKGYKVGLIDADIFGPSIPKMFDIENEQLMVHSVSKKELIIPAEKYGIKILSIGFFVDKNSAVIWRGPMASNFLKQMLEQSDWGELDYLLIDLPPGTSDIHITLVQSVPVTGVVIVSTPQDVAIADAVKGISLFRSEKINVPVLGLIENMAWFTPEELPDNKYYIFGNGGCRKLAEKMNVPLLGQIPLVQSIRENSDTGKPSALDSNTVIGQVFDELSDKLIAQVKLRNFKIDPTRMVEIENNKSQ
ncbi:MAG: Mrp/NBP35 family ATP-binding protein [Bacteroidota bacterium]